jgi:hypothetical protein
MPALRKTENESSGPASPDGRRPTKDRTALEAQAVPGDGQPTARPSAGASRIEPTDIEVSRLMAQSQRRHDLEMHLAALAIEYDRAIGNLQALIKRYDDIRADCEAVRLPINLQGLIPTILRTALKLARRQVRAEYPELRSLGDRS